MKSRVARKLRKVQGRLERLYALEQGPDVVDFVQIANDGSREQLLLRENDSELEIAVFLPELELTQAPGCPTDEWLQTIEGVSHFVHIVHRARTGLQTTQLELEFQAEVDKFVLLATERPQFSALQARLLHHQLYTQVRYLHAPGTEAGDRYRLANQLAARFALRLLESDQDTRLTLLRRFYRVGQTDKIVLARAA